MERDLRDQVAALFRNTPDIERLGDQTPGEIADAVMAVVAPIVAERDTLRQRIDLLRIEATDAAHDAGLQIDALQQERDKWAAAIAETAVRLSDAGYHGNLVDSVSRLIAEREALSEMLRGMARRVGDRRRDADRESKFRRASEIESYAAGERDRESRFRWAEEAARLEAKLNLPCGSCHPCTNYADQTWRAADRKPPHVHQWDEATALLQAYRAREDREVVFPQFWYDQVVETAHAPDRRAALRDLLESWRPSTVEATPAIVLMREGIERSQADATGFAGVRYGVHVGEIDAPPDAPTEPHPTAADLQAAIGVLYDVGTEATNTCGCPGSGSLAHVRGCRLHPEGSND